MRLGIDGREFRSPGGTGIGRYLADFIDWTAVHRTDVTPVVFLDRRRLFSHSSPRVETVVVNGRFTPLWDQVLLPRALKSNNIDVFLSPYFKMPMRAHCPVVLIVNDLIPIRLPGDQTGEGALKTLYFKITNAMAVKRAARIIAISEFTAREVAGEYGLRPESITVVPLGIRDTLKPERDPGALREAAARFGLERPYILYLGHLRASKNVGALIRAYGLLPEALREKYLLAIGGRRAGEYPRLAALVDELNLKENIRFLDFVKNDDHRALLSGASVFVYPSVYEGFGYPPLEAMACGVPVVSSTATSLLEVVGDAAAGVENPTPEKLADAISRVLSDKALRDSLVKKGLARAASFTVGKMARGFLEVIDSL